MQEPASVSSEMIGLPIGCFVVQVQSALSIDGPRRRWTEFNAIPTESTRSANYCDIRASTDAVRVGRWVGGTLVQREVWRVQDGGWHLDVVLEGVDYATASRIVLAVAQKTFVDRRRDDTSKVVGKDDHITGAYLGAAGSEYRFTALLNGGWESQTLYLTGAERVELHRLERRVS